MHTKPSDKIGSSGLIIFDGSCGGCSTLVGERRTFFEYYGFTVAALQESWVSELTGLSESTLREAIHLLLPSGEIRRGPDFFYYLASKVWWLRPMYWTSKIGFCRKLISHLYNGIAKRRMAISKVCGLQSRAKYKS